MLLRCPVKMSLLKYFSRKHHRLEPDETSSISESIESSDDGSQVVAESPTDESMKRHEDTYAEIEDRS